MDPEPDGPASFHDRFKIGSIDVGHHDDKTPVKLQHIENRQDAGARQQGRAGDVLNKALAPLDADGIRGCQYLESHSA